MTKDEAAHQFFLMAEKEAPYRLVMTFTGKTLVLYKDNFEEHSPQQRLVIHRFVTELMRNLQALNGCVLEVKENVRR